MLPPQKRSPASIDFESRSVEKEDVVLPPQLRDIDKFKEEILKKAKELGWKEVDKTNPPFTLGKELGKGSFGNVFIGFMNGEEVAVKFIDLTKHITRQHFDINELIQEMETLKDLKAKCGDYVSGYKDVFVDIEDQQLILIMELVEGVTLEDASYQNPDVDSIDYEEMIEAIESAKKAFECIFRHNYLHRDVKPDNIMVKTVEDDDGVTHLKVVLIDFGVSCVLNGDDFSRSCKGTRGSGAYWWWSPQIHSQGPSKNRTPEDDIYALGLSFIDAMVPKKEKRFFILRDIIDSKKKGNKVLENKKRKELQDHLEYLENVPRELFEEDIEDDDYEQIKALIQPMLFYDPARRTL